jgi:hypothetical protein
LNWSFKMPAAPIFVAIAVDYAVEAAAAYFMEAALADTLAYSMTGELISEAVVPNIISSAGMGALKGGITSAITGGDVGKGILSGGVGGAVGSAIGPSIREGVSSIFPSFAAPAISKGATEAVKGIAGGVASGQSLGDAAEGGLKRGVASGLTDYIVGATKDDPKAPDSISNQVERAGVQYGITQLMGQPTGVTPRSVDAGSATTTGQPGATAGEAGVGAPGSAALAQALRVDPGAPTFGGQGEGEQKPVWNLASLKLKDETGA